MPSKDDFGLPLAALIPAAELARLQRRVRFLEAALAQVLRDERQVREWFSAAELAALRLPGLPATASGIARLARREAWEARTVRGRRGAAPEWHFSALPRAAFAELLRRVVRAEAGAPATAAGDMPAPALAAPEAAPQAPAGANATPPWVLPLLRLLRGGATSLDGAVAALAQALPPGNQVPTMAEARDTLRALGVKVL